MENEAIEVIDKFWVVWNVKGAFPNKRHTSRESAVTEAHRLARENGNQTFMVFESIGEAKVVRSHWVEHYQIGGRK